MKTKKNTLKQKESNDRPRSTRVASYGGINHARSRSFQFAWCLTLMASMIFFFTSCNGTPKKNQPTPTVSQTMIEPSNEIENNNEISESTTTSTDIRIFFFEDFDDQMYYIDRAFLTKEDADPVDLFTEVFKAPEFLGYFEYLFGDDYTIQSIHKTDQTVRIELEKNPDYHQGLGATYEADFIESLTNTIGYYFKCEHVQLYINGLHYDGGHLDIPEAGFYVFYERAMPISEKAEPTGSEISMDDEYLYHPENEDSFMFGVAPFYNEQYLIGYMDHQGNTVVEPRWEPYHGEGTNWGYHQAPFSEGLALVFKNNKAGFVNRAGEIVIEPQFDYAESFSEGLALVMVGTGSDERYGFINRQGDYVIEPTFSYASSFIDGRAKIKVEDKYGYIDQSGAIVIAPQWEQANDFSEGFAVIMDEFNHYGYIDTEGTLLGGMKFYGANAFKGGLAVVVRRIEGEPVLYGAINTKGKMVIPFRHGFINFFSEGLSVFEQNGKYGYMDETGAVVIPPVWDEAFYFSEAFAIVRKGNQWGSINKNGDLVIDLQSEWVPMYYQPGANYVPIGFSEGLARVYNKQDDTVFINTEGEIVLPKK